MIETSVGNYEIIKDVNNVFNISDFEKRFCEILNIYEYIVGDYSQEILRLKGFKKEDVCRIPDYVNEYCALDSQYYVLKNLSYNPNYVIEEE